MELPAVLASVPGMRAAELVIDGLTVLCFNTSSENFWEVAYPRRARHTLFIKIEALDAAGVPIVPPLVEEEVNRNVRSFNISLSDGSVAHYAQFPRGGPRADDFDRSTPANNDPNDLGWLIDLAGDELEHGNLLRLKPSHPSRPISLARIRHSLFCTLEPEADDVKIAPREADDPDAGTVLGKTNAEIVGVLLGNGPGEIRFEFDPPGSFHLDPLQYDEKRRYRIEIINEDDQSHVSMKGFVRGDLRLYYDDVIEVDGEPKDLWARPARADKRFAPDGDCHGTEFSGGTLEDLISP